MPDMWNQPTKMTKMPLSSPSLLSVPIQSSAPAWPGPATPPAPACASAPALRPPSAHARAPQQAMRPTLAVPAGGQIVALPQDVPVAPPRKSSPLASDSGPPRGPRPWSRPAAWAGAPLPREQANLVGARGRELGRRRARVLRSQASTLPIRELSTAQGSKLAAKQESSSLTVN
ncbi:hypothetical protein PVAP13_2NG641301 [Panicum virgatum]|uniref:Uncharacterized protein n=1 Tax=Panicum virgatum TaxID=38727 RepID=A0A8T0VUU1_PANVG|nr:hypothetical protein PVAP13_2NG641301 [Panicum virgatum]